MWRRGTISRPSACASVSARPWDSRYPITTSRPLSASAAPSCSMRYVLPTPGAMPIKTFRCPLSSVMARGMGRYRSGTARQDPPPAPAVSDAELGLIFAGAAAISIGASWRLVTSLERVGARLNLSEALLGMLAALAADAPEITAAVTALARHQQSVGAGVVIGSNVFTLAALIGLAAVVGGSIALHPRVIELAGAVALWIAGVSLTVVTGVLSPLAGLVAGLAVLAPYVARLGALADRRDHRGGAGARGRDPSPSWPCARRPAGAGRGRRGCARQRGDGALGLRAGDTSRRSRDRYRRTRARCGDKLAQRGRRSVPGDARQGHGCAQHGAQQQRLQHPCRLSDSHHAARAGRVVGTGDLRDRELCGDDGLGARLRVSRSRATSRRRDGDPRRLRGVRGCASRHCVLSSTGAPAGGSPRSIRVSMRTCVRS